MMDYYEELGVSRSASPEEIRQAYRHLVRLLHPDRCSDEGMRELAALQMRRLNAVLTVLIHPEERDSYDLTLLPCGAARGIPPKLSGWQAPLWLWPVLGAVVLTGLVCMLIRAPHQAPAMEAPGEAAPSQAASATKGSHGPARAPRTPVLLPVPAVPQGRGSPPSQAPRAAEEAIPASPGVESTVEEPATVHAMTVPLDVLAPEFPQPAPPRPGWAGEWLFVASRNTPTASLYPPVYIELRVTEDSGVVHGRYRARYHVADRAISPTVAFQFEGRASAEGAKFPWIGAGGSKGEVTLRLLANGAMEVTWEANQLGRELSLIAGTATLVRRLD